MIYKYKKKKKEDSQAKVAKQWRFKAESIPPSPIKQIHRFTSILQRRRFCTPSDFLSASRAGRSPRRSLSPVRSPSPAGTSFCFHRICQMLRVFVFLNVEVGRKWRFVSPVLGLGFELMIILGGFTCLRWSWVGRMDHL